MFTGLIQDLGTIVAAQRRGGPLRLTVAPDAILPSELELGESVAVSGPCLTVVGVTGDTVSFDVGAESVDRTTVSQWRPGRRVNMERALRLGDRLGGHLVLGHVDAVGEVLGRREEQGVTHLTVSMPESMAPLVCEKGSVSIDGVSLTVNEVDNSSLRVTLIPETLGRTTLSLLGRGDCVNLEADILARHLARLVSFSRGVGSDASLDLEFLGRHGYL